MTWAHKLDGREGRVTEEAIHYDLKRDLVEHNWARSGMVCSRACKERRREEKEEGREEEVRGLWLNDEARPVGVEHYRR